ncbi:MAG: methionine biosynthesis protein MetW, partial [Alphaproteobacteria bacterium]
WYNTPNIHFCSIKDFTELCREMGITAERAMALDHHGSSIRNIDAAPLLSNLMGEQAVFLLKK